MVGVLVWVLTHERQVERAALAVAAVAALLVAVGLVRIGMHRWRAANAVIDHAVASVPPSAPDCDDELLAVAEVVGVRR